MAIELDCPSVPSPIDSVVIGIVQRDAGRAEVAMLRKPVPFAEIADLIPPDVDPTEVLRLSAPCAGSSCQHFADHRCSLASRVVENLPAHVASPPACALRPTCRWWRQEGPAACRRCPGITTQPSVFSAAMIGLATPDTGFSQL